jgi:tRNA threonylcarbamoyl adenosine modification protein (Sua5/YciO/YrdC/YwlC family)
VSQIFNVTSDVSPRDVEAAVATAVDAVREGKLVVIPTDTSYAVICDAFNSGAINLLRIAKKQTSDVALPIAAGSIETIRGVANLSTLANDLAQAFWPGPLTLLTQAQDSLAWNLGGNGAALAVRVPHNDVAITVLNQIGPTVLTGAQAAGDSQIQNVEQAQLALGDSVAIYLDAGELSGTVSTVVDATTGNLRMIRSGSLSLAQLREVMPIVIDASASN